MVVSHFISQGFELPAKEVMLKDLESKIEKAGGKSKVDTFLFTGFDYVQEMSELSGLAINKDHFDGFAAIVTKVAGALFADKKCFSYKDGSYEDGVKWSNQSLKML